MKADANEKLLLSTLNIGRIIKEQMHNDKELCNFSRAEMEALNYVKNNNISTMRSIAGYLHIKPPSVTALIENLEKKGNIKKAKSHTDKREICVKITPKGNRLLKTKHDNIQKSIKKIFKTLSNKDKQALVQIFEKIIKNYDENK